MKANLVYESLPYITGKKATIAHSHAISKYCTRKGLTLPRKPNGSPADLTRIVAEFKDVAILNDTLAQYAEKFYNIPQLSFFDKGREIDAPQGLQLPTKKEQTLSHIIKDFDDMAKRLLHMELILGANFKKTIDTETESAGYLAQSKGVSEIKIKYNRLQNDDAEVVITLTGFSEKVLRSQRKIIESTFNTFDRAEELRIKHAEMCAAQAEATPA
jgi:hypothetical protein